jgi:hypothetical protein
MVRRTGIRRGARGAQPAAPMGVSTVFAITQYALPLANQRFSYMENCIGYYLNPYIGKSKIYEITDTRPACCMMGGSCTS